MGRVTPFLAMILLSGCAHPVATFPLDPPATDAHEILASQAWTDTGIDVDRDITLDVTASGRVRRPLQSGEHKTLDWVSPAGSYEIADDTAASLFPLPAGTRGPAPAWSLIARIGDGEPFYIGRRFSGRVSHSGRLWLGMNQPSAAAVPGAFHAVVATGGHVTPAWHEQLVDEPSANGSLPQDTRVVVFYIDGLRPDVVREMAAMGHLPVIRRLFIDGGCWLENTVTVFPSNTLTANASMWTGCFPDRHGLKSTIEYSRRSRTSHSHLDLLGPVRAGQRLASVGLERLADELPALARAEWHGAGTGPAAPPVAPLYAILHRHGLDWSTGVLPLATQLSPPMWTRSMTRHLPWFASHRAMQFIDEANATFALRHLLKRRDPVTVIWLPETDTVSHGHGRGQFGITRRTIVRADRLIGRLVDDLAASGDLEHTCLMLVSDHGHHGGRDRHLRHFDLAHELFFRPRTITNGRWVGGGLGLSVRQHRLRHNHPGDRHFVFVDGLPDGVAHIYLPRGRYDSADWSEPNRPGDLLAYPIASNRPPVNMVDCLTAASVIGESGDRVAPVDLVLLRLKRNTLLISTRDRGTAVIDRRRDPDGRWRYRYRVASSVEPAADGEVRIRIDPEPTVDPLRLLEHHTASHLAEYHDESTWLRLTVETAYPDGVVAISRGMFWQPPAEALYRSLGPDLVVTARRGWYFGPRASSGSMHGYPLRDSMRACWFVAGPGIRRGARVRTPCRLVDLTPTILELVGLTGEVARCDGRPVTSIYQSAHGRRMPVAWCDLDLQAWSPLDYRPRPRHDGDHTSVNRPREPLDLNNLVYNVMSLPDISPFRLIDAALDGTVPAGYSLLNAVERADESARRTGVPWIAGGAGVLDLPDAAISDYSPTSSGNLHRLDRLVDWLQERLRVGDARLARPIGRTRLPGNLWLNQRVDDVQSLLRDSWRIVRNTTFGLINHVVLDGIEDHIDRVLNAGRSVPAEIVVEPGPLGGGG